MDIKLEKKPWYIRYRYYLIGGLLFAAFLIYVIVLSLGPRKLRIDAENIQIAEVKEDNFMEYVDVEGLIQPILTIKINTREAGSVESIIGEEGSLLQQGDTIIVLSNPDLLRSIEDQRDEWEKQMITYQEQEIEMEQKSLNLKQQALTNNYVLERLKKSIALDREEFQMGVKSKAQLQVAEDEYNYKLKNAALQQESLRHDSAVTMIHSLASEQYRAVPGSNAGFLLMHSTGSLPHGKEIDVPLVYADYYFLEALLRYQKIGKES